MKTALLSLALAGLMGALAGCATPLPPEESQIAPDTVPYPQFQSDAAHCRRVARAETGNPAAAENSQIATGATTGAFLGALSGIFAGGGDDPIEGLGAGALVGSALGMQAAGNETAAWRAAYDASYRQCMSRAEMAPAAPPAPPDPGIPPDYGAPPGYGPPPGYPPPP